MSKGKNKLDLLVGGDKSLFSRDRGAGVIAPWVLIGFQPNGPSEEGIRTARLHVGTVVRKRKRRMKIRMHAVWISLVLVLTTGPSFSPAEAVANDKKPVQEALPKVSAVQGELDIAGVSVKKGDARDSVMRQLSQIYELQKLRSAQGEEDSWLISAKAEPDDYVGVVSFDSGRVRRVARFQKWTQNDDSVELAQRLCELLEKLTSERGQLAKIEVRSTESGNVSVRGVEMIFGDKRVSFNIVSRNSSDGAQKEVHLDEVIQ